MPLKYWVEAFQTTVYTINLLPSSPLRFLTPIEKLYRKQPKYMHLQTFGCACFPYLRPYSKNKFNFHSSKCVFLDYSQIQARYKCLYPSGRVYITRHVVFNPKEFPFSCLFSTQSPTQVFYVPSLSTGVLHSCPSFHSGHSSPVAPIFDIHETSAPLVSSPVTTADPTVPEQSASSSSVVPVAPQLRQAPALPTHPMLTRAKARQLSLTFPYAFVSFLEPNSVQEALLDPNWTKAIGEEYSALLRNET